MDYLLKINTKDADGNSDPKYIATDRNIVFEGVEASPLLSIPTGNSKSIDPSSRSVSVSSIKTEILNKNDLETSKIFYDLIETDGIMFYREKAELYSYDGEEFKLVFAGMIRSISSDSYEQKYTLEVADWFDEFKKPVFEIELAEYNNTPVEDINEHRMPDGFTCYEEPEYPEADEGNQGELIRKIKFEGSTNQFFKGFLQKIFSHDQIVVESGHLVDNWTDMVDEASIDEITGISNVKTLYFEFEEKIDDGYKFLKEQLYPLLNCYPLIDSNMRISYKLHRQPTVEEANEIQENSALFINEANTISVEEKNIDFENLINHIIIKDKYRFDENKYMRSTYYTQGDSFRKFKKLIPENPHTIELKGISKYTEEQIELCLADIRDRVFSRYSKHIVTLTVSIPLSSLRFACGDYVLFDNSHVISWEGANRGTRGIVSDTPKDEDPYAKVNMGDEWQGYLDGNQFAYVYGREVVKMTKEITHELFNGAGGCLENHSYVEAWLGKENS